MARFTTDRNAPSCTSLEPATDAKGGVLGYYVKLSDGSEAFMSGDFVREHWGVPVAEHKARADAAEAKLAEMAAAAASTPAPTTKVESAAKSSK